MAKSSRRTPRGYHGRPSIFSPGFVAGLASVAKRLNFKNAGSHTLTKSKSKPETVTNETSTGDFNKLLWKKKKVSRGKVKAAKRFKAKVERVLESETPICRVLEQYSGTTSATAGGQSVMVAFDDRAIANLRAVMTNLEQNAASLDDFAARYHLYNSMVDGFYSNSGTGLVIMDWYDIVSRTDNINTPVDDYILALQAIANGGEVLTTGAISGRWPSVSGSVVTQGITPFNLSEFCAKWKILKKRRVMLQPGETKQVNFYNKRQMTVDGARFMQGAAIYKYNKGARSHFIISYGQPCHDSVTRTSVAPGPVSIDYFYTVVHQARGLPSINDSKVSGASRLYQNSSYPAVTTGKIKEEFNPSVDTTMAS